MNNARTAHIAMLLSLVATLIGCSQQIPIEACGEFNSVIDHNIKEVAISEIDGDVSDKSAMQQGARLARNNNRLSVIAINVQLQAQNKCPPRQKPIDPSLYVEPAKSCYMARLEQLTSSYGSDESKKNASQAKADSACDFKTWNAPKQK